MRAEERQDRKTKKNGLFAMMDINGVYLSLFRLWGMLDEAEYKLIVNDMAFETKCEDTPEQEEKQDVSDVIAQILNENRSTQHQDSLEEELEAEEERETPDFNLRLNDSYTRDCLANEVDFLKDCGFLKRFNLLAAYDAISLMNTPLLLKMQESGYLVEPDNSMQELTPFFEEPEAMEKLKADDAQKALFLMTVIAYTCFDSQAYDRTRMPSNRLVQQAYHVLNDLPEYFYANQLEKVNAQSAKVTVPAQKIYHNKFLHKIAQCFKRQPSVVYKDGRLFCYNPQDADALTQKQIQERLMKLRNLANQAIDINPVWENGQKFTIASTIDALNIPQSRFIHARRQPKNFLGHERDE